MVDYAPLPAVVTIQDALDAGDPERVCLEWSVGDRRAVNVACETAAHVTRLALHNHRIVTNSMEPRGAIGTYDPEDGRYTLHVSAQSLHMARDRVAETLGVDASMVRLIAPDVGGGFGVKNFMYAEMVLLCWAARVAGRPVKWINARSDGFVSDHQARDNDARAALALDADGNFLALKVEGWGNLGAYLTGSMARIFTEQFVKLPGGAYRIPAVTVDIGAVYTNTVPTGVTRGPGFAEFANIMERLIDRAAAETGRDPGDMRRQNLAADMPHTNAVGAVIDSGRFAENVDFAVARARDGYAVRKASSKTPVSCAASVSAIISRLLSVRPRRTWSCGSPRMVRSSSPPGHRPSARVTKRAFHRSFPTCWGWPRRISATTQETPICCRKAVGTVVHGPPSWRAPRSTWQPRRSRREAAASPPAYSKPPMLISSLPTGASPSLAPTRISP